MTLEALLGFMRQHRVAVQASVSDSLAPQAAVVGIAITDDFEIVFDTLTSTRKSKNLRGNPRIALVLGGLGPADERTVQYEGIADEPGGSDLERLKQVYYGVYRDGPDRLAWPGLIYIRVRPTWIRYSDYTTSPPTIVEFGERDFHTRR